MCRGCFCVRVPFTSVVAPVLTRRKHDDGQLPRCQAAEVPAGLPADRLAHLHSCALQSRLLMLCSMLMMALMWSRYRQGLGLAASSPSSQELWGAAGSGSRGSGRSASSPASGSSSLLEPVDASSTLQFDVCNGFTNQRIALMSGESRPAPGWHPRGLHGQRGPATFCLLALGPMMQPQNCAQQACATWARTPQLQALLSTGVRAAGADPPQDWCWRLRQIAAWCSQIGCCGGTCRMQ